jgi:transglutaminase-like putative cysteine protease
VRRGERRLALALWIALCAAIVPLLSVVSPGAWLIGATLLPAAVLITGAVLRRLRVPALGVTFAELAVWVAAITAVFLPTRAVLLVIPTPDAFSAATQLVQRASSEILLGVAPIDPTVPIAFVIVAAIGALTIALDHVVVTARMPLMASIALVAVWLIPAIAVSRGSSGIDVVSFVVLAAAILVLIRAETRTREAPEPGSSSGVTAVAVSSGAIAVVLALVVAPALPAPVVPAAGNGQLASIDPSLNLGDDLRQSSEATVLRIRTDAPTPPYLRVATLSLFDGNVWRPDRLRSVPLEEDGLEPVVADDGIRVTQYRTNIEITNLASAYLPVPYPAVAIDGLNGLWRAVPFSRTVLSGQTNAQGQQYEVVSQVPRPTAEQIRAAETSDDESAVDVLSLPEDTPSIITDLAAEVTAGQTNDYDRLIALQSWFRGPEFTYSLQAPVVEGFDGTGTEAVAAFLEMKQGYCIHFAGAFALMARALDIPSRIVVGFLPGTSTSDTEEGQRVSEVSTSQLHAWPEVYFEGIGWVAFEPTKSLGTETRFLPETQSVDEGGEIISGPTPTASRTPSASAAPTTRPDDGPVDAGPATPAMADLRPFLLTVGGIVVVVLAPLLVQAVRRRRWAARARGGDTAAAWRILQDAAIDLGIAVPASDSPRAFGSRLVADNGAPEIEISRLVGAIERASYSSARPAVETGAQAAADALAARRSMLAAVSPAARARALLLPRSLIVRPGSVFAGSGITA